MAIFYIIAKKDTAINWDEIHGQLNKQAHGFICLFPINIERESYHNGIGITASGKFAKKLKEVKKELLEVLNIMWKNEFIVYDLYRGRELTVTNYQAVLNYIR